MNQTCPECQSSETKWIEKKAMWRCQSCDEAFDGPAPDSTTASPSPISSPPDPIPDSLSLKMPSLSDKAAVPKKIFFSIHDSGMAIA